MKKGLTKFISIILLYGAAPLSVSAAMYSYTGNNYTSSTAYYTPDMFVSGWFETADVLAPGLYSISVITDYHFTDGVNSYTADGVNNYAPAYNTMNAQFAVNVYSPSVFYAQVNLSAIYSKVAPDAGNYFLDINNQCTGCSSDGFYDIATVNHMYPALRSDYIHSATGSATGKGEWTVTPAPVPLPAAVWLFGSALAGLGFISRKKNKGSVNSVTTS